MALTMPDWERFANAPISEAILDIAVRFPAPPELGRLEAFHDLIREHYPIKQGRVQWHGRIELGQERVAQEVRRSAEGFLFRSGDSTRVVQARQDGFTFNWLKRYDSWSALRDQARPHWERYREMFRPEEVIRLGLRYVNRIEIPLPFADFREYVKTAPDIASGLPQGLSALFMRLEIPDGERGLAAVVTETFERPIDKGTRLPFIFDIDIIRSATFEPTSSAIWETFEKMRDYKNDIFFNSITDRAKALFR